VQAPANDIERLERLLDDGPALLTRFAELAGARAHAGDAAGIVELAHVAARAEDPHRAYQAIRDGVHVLFMASHLQRADEPRSSTAWAAYHDAAVGLLVPWLEEHPHEPELLNLLGVCAYELGHTKVARRLFEAIREMGADNEGVRSNLRGCKERMQRGVGTPSVPDAQAPNWAAMSTRAKRIAERATKLTTGTISVCMIVKDEESMLPGCLEAVAPHVDQIVVVDTGSTDRTKEIAAEYGALVADFEWNGSFSDARNESLRHATGDWVLWLDADEYIVDGDGPLLRELTRKTWIEGFQIVETHFTGATDSGNQAAHTPMRLFQRRDGYAWRGAVHEQLLWAFPTWLPERFEQSALRVDHYGYLSTVINSRGKHERNLTLLLDQVKTDRSAFTCFNIATEYGALGDWRQAHTWSEEALTRAREDEGWQHNQFAPLMVQRAIVARRGVGHYDGANELAEQALGWWPEYTDLIYEQAATYAATAQWQQAAEYAGAAIAQGDAPAKFVSTSGKGSFKARQVLATAHLQLGDVEGARDELEEITREAPHFLETFSDLTAVLMQLDGAPAASSHLDELLGARVDDAAPNLLIAVAFHEAGAFDEADERYGRVLAARAGHAAALTARSELRLAQRDFDGAWEIAMSIDAADPFAGVGARSAFLAAVVAKDSVRMLETLVRITDSAELAVAERAVYRGWAELIEPTGVTGIVPVDPVATGVVLTNLEALAKLEAFDEFEQLLPLTEQVLPDEQIRRKNLAQLFIRRRFPDLAGEQLLACAERFGADAEVLSGLGTVATMKGMWEDAEVLLGEALELDPSQTVAQRLLADVRQHRATNAS
jgi:tetratricopeptide (TPR) repeat protein